MGGESRRFKTLPLLWFECLAAEVWPKGFQIHAYKASPHRTEMLPLCLCSLSSTDSGPRCVSFTWKIGFGHGPTIRVQRRSMVELHGCMVLDIGGPSVHVFVAVVAKSFDTSDEEILAFLN